MNSQLAMPVSMGRAAIVPVAASNTNTVLSGRITDVGSRSASARSLEHHLDVGAVAGEQPGFLRVVELGLDLDRAGLLLLIEHVRRHAAHVPRETRDRERRRG